MERLTGRNKSGEAYYKNALKNHVKAWEIIIVHHAIIIMKPCAND